MQSSVFTVRASSWGSLFDCAHAWEGVHILGIRKPSGMRALLGTAVHAGTAAFDRARLDGTPCTPDDAAGVLVDTLKDPGFEVDQTSDGISISQAERIALPLLVRYCADVAPQFDFIDVETQLNPLDIDCGGGMTVRLTGSMDRARVAETGEGVVIPDIKTGLRVVTKGEANIHGRSPQTGTYQLMYDATKGLRTAGAQIIALSTSGSTDTAVSKVFDARRVMVGTDSEPGLIEHAASMFRTGLFPPNPSSVLCSKKYCARWNSCIFHE
ncbi:PD-(D/E)XK endonuclease-like domain-containing protein [Bordetella tumbae]|uniref:RecB family exonuclease n=1 Tax=Bordetella tumbae TaxID=1649139 RepID=UPI0039EF4894